MSASDPPAVVVAPRPPQVGHNFELGKGGGGPPPLATAALSHLAAGWPALADLRAAASARRGSGRLRNEISALVCDVRVALAAAFLGGLPDSDDVSLQQAAEDAQGAAASRSVASRVYSDARTLLVDCGPALKSHWHLSDDQWRELRTALESVVGPAAAAGPAEGVDEVLDARFPLRGLSGWRMNMAPLSSSRLWRTVFASTRLLMASVFWDTARIPTMIISFTQTLRCSGP